MYRIKRPFRATGGFLLTYFSIYRVALFIIIIALAIWYFTRVTLKELWPNIIPELLSIAVTVFIIDTLYQKRSDDETKKILVGKMGSNKNDVATEAWMEIKARGWGFDGTLEGKFLLSANLDGNSFTGAAMRKIVLSFSSLRDTSWIETDLEGASLDHTDLSGATLSSYPDGRFIPEANLTDVSFFNSDLTGARVRPEQLVKARSLSHAIMPDGSKYDGRYRSPEDVERIEKVIRNLGGDVQSPVEIAQLYGVPVKVYVAGQLWANQHPRLFEGRQARLEIIPRKRHFWQILLIVSALIGAFLLGSLDWNSVLKWLGF